MHCTLQIVRPEKYKCRRTLFPEIPGVPRPECALTGYADAVGSPGLATFREPSGGCCESQMKLKSTGPSILSILSFVCTCT